MIEPDEKTEDTKAEEAPASEPATESTKGTANTSDAPAGE